MPECLLIDGNNIVFRAFYAFQRQRLKTSAGKPTGAVYGFLRMLLKLLKERKPDLVAVAFDTSRNTFRKKMYPDYKAKRKPTPEDLLSQLPLAQKAVEALGISVLKNEEYEADDLIGSAAQVLKSDYTVSVVTGDRDLLQLIDSNVIVELCQKGTSETKAFDNAMFEEEYGFPPIGIIELKALMGDSSDNIPGVKGIGEKKGMALIQEYGTIEKLYSDLESVKNVKMREKLAVDEEMARLSHELATIKLDIPCADEKAFAWKTEQFTRNEFLTFLQEMEFKTLFKEYSGKEFVPAVDSEEPSLKPVPGERLLVNSGDELNKFLNKLGNEICIDIETDGFDPIKNKIVGVSIASNKETAIYVPLRHAYLGIAPSDQMLPEDFFPALQNAMKGKLLIGHNLKFDLAFLVEEGVTHSDKIFDTLLAAYVIDPTRSNALKKLGIDLFGFEVKEFKHVAKGDTFAAVPIDQATDYGCQDTLLTMHLYELVKGKLDAEGLTELFLSLETPLIPIIQQMEKTGIKLNHSYISDLSEEISNRVKELEAIIHSHAGSIFNVNSTKQLQKVLFEDLGLTPPKKTKTGYSTDSEVLQKLSKFHPICSALLEFRELSKLKSTYTDTLISLVHKDTGLIHASFNQAVTATGRLSSSNPNMQNIPIKSEWGRKIRRAFLPPIDGHKLISIDYSQIELRLLAHFSQDPALLEAYRAGTDIHAITAGKLFDKPAEEVTYDERRIGKTVNFGIIYGISAHGLGEDLDIPRYQAKEYIDSFYSNFPGVTKFFENVVEQAQKDGKVETLLGRVRQLPDINAKRFQARSAAERVAKNTRLQGSAADLVKKAMLDTAKLLCDKGFETKLILQIHDELVFSVPEAEVAMVAPLLKECMENAVKLEVPLVCDVAIGPNLADLEDLN